MHDPDQMVAMTTLKSRLQKCLFGFLIETMYPQDFVNMLARANKFANAEEAYELNGTTAKEAIKEKRNLHRRMARKLDVD